ncbi:SusD/RagB family nutrient-binding outer membrane lipoprotein [Ilyomonas limi]|uniref:SusD/RagB family nutrient-binding outer membrane lipoprotein n=1 Tax=Ilyomonas limi TaxID=2575867 RepID=A0A4U3L9S4_9BACT|nr:SusD/RagB family nutrient-binding outer membrane lipoprotein [Ilyomonas limi]TKK71880.1 SusD/RagB family nutrient-binding outer membrane lipoprotein [Ilyomonas limi]
MKNYKLFIYIFAVAVALQLTTSCNKYDYYQTNPNNPSQATPALLLTDICVRVFVHDGLPMAYASRYLAYYERPDVNANYGWGAASFDNYDILRQVEQMNTLAIASNEVNYQAIAKLFRAVLFSQLTETFGDIPYAEALKVDEGNNTPVYDAQESIYVGILKELDEANSLFDATQNTISGDIIFDGDISKWKKFTNAFRLRLLIHLSKKEDNTNLNIKQQFQSIISNPAMYPLMESNDDNAQIVFNKTAANNSYPGFQSNSLQTSISMEQGFVDSLKVFADPRLFKVAAPVSGLPAGNFSSYEGVNEGLTVGEMQTASADASRIAPRYWQDQINEPMMLLGYQEQEFLIAEAISRNWISGAGTAEEHYKNGIVASMQFYGVPDADIQNYLATPKVKLAAATALQQIAVQKYFSMFMQAGWEPFYEQRRTGIPVFNVGDGTYNDQRVPRRWLYPQNEYNVNKANVDAAVQRQFNGDDDINGVIWLLK